MSKVYIVGAGPGDIELITVKGKKAIDSCDVILYDNYLDTAVMNDNINAKKIYVGKIAGESYLKQEDINELIYKYAKEGNIVVRLKGGDPFVFGRGGEEAIFLTERGIDVEVIPGISSSISATTNFGIPITHRGISRSFTVITASNKIGDIHHINFEALSKIGGTLVFLMARKNSQIIANKLIEHGLDKNTPAAFIMDATGVNNRIIKSNLEMIAVGEYQNELKSPLTMVVGEVVRLNVLKNNFEFDNI